MSSSKTVNDRARSAALVLESGRENAEEAGRVLAEAFEPLREDGEPAIDWTQVVRLLARAPQALAEPMVEADKALVAERMDDPAAREARDAAEEKAATLLVELRAAAEVVYGPEGGRALGFEGTTPRRSQALLRALEAALSGLEELATLPPQRSLRMDAEDFRGPLSSAHAALKRALGEVDQESRQLQSAQASKDEAVEAYDYTFLHSARALESLMRLAHLARQADQVRPSARRPGRTHAEAAEGADAGGEGEEEGSESSDEA